MTAQTTLQPRALGAIDTTNLDPVQRVLLGFLAKYREPTRGNYYTDLQGYAAWCEQRNYKMLGVGPLELQLYIEYLRGRGLAEATVGRRYGTVSSLLKYAYRLEVIPKNPADFVDRPTVNRALQKTPRLSPLELADVIRQARRHSRPVNTYHRNLAIVLLMGFMGLRVGEVCGLNIEGVIESEGQPAIKFIGKRQKVATMVMPWAALQAVRATIGDRTTGPVFVKMQGVHKGDRLTRPDVAHVIEALCTRAGIDRHITPHSRGDHAAHHATLVPPVVREDGAHARTAAPRDSGGAPPRRRENDVALHRDRNDGRGRDAGGIGVPGDVVEVAGAGPATRRANLFRGPERLLWGSPRASAQ